MWFISWLRAAWNAWTRLLEWLKSWKPARDGKGE